MYSKLVSGVPADCKDKRFNRILEALHMESGTFENQKKHVIYNFAEGKEAYFLKPGKETRRKSSVNPNDMLPCVDGIEKKYSFADVWGNLCKLQNAVSADSYKKLSVILYRLAFLLDFNNVNGKVRFSPSEEILGEISSIQKEADEEELGIDVLSLFYFIDLLGWNEDVKYHRPFLLPNGEYSDIYDGLKERAGRINTILTCISVPLSFQRYTENVIKNAASPSNIDFSLGLKIAQALTNRRGIYTLTNPELVEFLSPYLT